MKQRMKDKEIYEEEEEGEESNEGQSQLQSEMNTTYLQLK